MIECPNCTNQNALTSCFCEHCGTQLPEEKRDINGLEEDVIEIVQTLFGAIRKISQLGDKNIKRARGAINEAIQTMKECGKPWHSALKKQGKNFCPKCGKNLRK